MTLMQRIKSDQLEARKSRDAVRASLLTTLIGEASAVGKNDGNRETTDAELVAMIKKFLKNVDETLKVADTEQARVEKQILAGLLPAQLSNEELAVVVKQIVVDVNATSPKDMGVVMKALKEQYDGRYDGSAASSIVKQALSA